MIKIIIADDHQLFIVGIKSILKSIRNMEIIGEVNNGNLLLELLEQQQCDVILMDINMPEMNGIDATKIIKSKFPF